MGIAQSGRGFVLPGKVGEVPQNRQQLTPEISQSLPVEDEVRVVGDITAGSPQVDDAGGGGSGLAVGVDMGHHIVADFPLPLGGQLKVNILDMGLQLCHLFTGDGQSQIVFRPGQRHPQPPPGPHPGFGGE